MDQEPKSSASSPLTSGGLMALLLLAAGTFFVGPPLLRDLRPAAGEPRLEEPHDLQDVEARLWQDPLGAVQRVREARKATATAATEPADRHDISPLMPDARSANCSSAPHVIAVTLDGSPYSEPVESRRRTRYAVLSALHVSGYAPEDTEHLGYVLVPRLFSNRPRPLGHTVASPGDVGATEPAGRFAIPYEWLRAPPNPAHPQLCQRLLVLWIDSHLLGSRPLTALTELAQRFASSRLDDDPMKPPRAPRAGAPPDWLVIGPNESDALRNMVIEATPDTTSPATYQSHYLGGKLRIYSNRATVPDSVLLESIPRAGPASVPSRVASSADAAHSADTAASGSLLNVDGVTLVRSIGDDASMARTMVGELSRRGLRATTTIAGRDDACGIEPRRDASPDTIAVVADWDTLYGRKQRAQLEASPSRAGFCLAPFSYVRGLDGQLADTGTAGSQAAPADDKAKSGDKSSGGKGDGSQIERAEGQGQLDYLRRLAYQMHDRDRALRGADNGRGIRAIGVLGNDLHDKLLVLQMLKGEFPDVLFFTTDLDARYYHPSEQAWARNLIVASSFGLRLADPLQRDTPPFRDTYQTSAFFATRLALADAGIDASATHFDPGCLKDALARPRVFEIGRTHAFDFSDDIHGPGSAACNIHPPGTPMFSTAATGRRIAVASVAFLLIGGIAFVSSPSFRRALSWPGDTSEASSAMVSRRLRVAICLLFALAYATTVAVAVEWLPIARWLTRQGKPMLLTEGLSTWPTEAIRALAFMLCIYLIGRGWTSLARGLDQIAHDFCLVSRQQLRVEQQAYERGLPWLARLWNIFEPRVPTELDAPTSRADGLSLSTVMFWKHYLVQTRLFSRLTRAAACFVLMTIVLVLLESAIGTRQAIPSRGDVSLMVDQGMRRLLFFASFLLLFFVVDATLFCVSFVRHLTGREHAWPPSTLQAFQQRFDLPPELLTHWINISFIRARTACVCPLIYHPFIVLSLLLMAANAFFDDWILALGTKLAVGLCAVIAVVCAVMLRRTTETARSRTLELIDEFLARARGPNAGAAQSSAIEQATWLRRKVENLDEGAFARFTQQPLLRAALLPFAAVGGTSLLDALSLINL